MTEYARLVVAVDSTQAAKARAELEKLPGAAGRAESSANRMGASFAKLGGILASAISIREIARASEQYVNMTNRLRLVTEGSEQLAYAQEAVMRAAQQTYQPLETTAEVYQRIAQNASALGLSFAEVEAITKTVSRTIALSGADTQAAAGAMRQFGQALASGSLRGDELNSILEGTPALAQAVARGLGVTTGELRAMGAEGELTASKIIAALQSQEAAVEEMSRTMNVTAGQAMVTFGNALVGIVGKLDEASGASRGFASAVLDLSGALTRFSSGEFMDFFRDSKQTAEGFNNEISVTLSQIRDLTDARAKLDKNDPDDTVLFRFKFWNKEELDAEITGLNSQVQRFQKARDRLVELSNKPGEETPKGDGSGTPVITPPPEKTDKATQAIDRQIQALRLQADTLGMTADQVELYKLASEGASDIQLQKAAAALEAVSAYEKQAEAIRLVNEAEEQNNREAASILESLRTEEEQIRESYERRRQIIIDATLLTEQQKNAALLALKQEHDEKMVQANGSYWERYMLAAKESLQSFDELSSIMLENFTGRFGDAFESMVFDSQSLGDAVSNLAQGMARSVVNALGQMAAQWVAYQALQLALGKANETAAIAGAVATGSSMAAAYAPAAAMASLASFGANSVPAMAAITSTTTLAQGMAMMSFDGGGFTGYGPRSGGLDGKGGFLAMMHPQETVIDHTKSGGNSGSGGGVMVNVNLVEDASRAGTVEKSQNPDGSWDVTAFVADLHGDGPAARAISQYFGIQKVGR
ncbi:tape measure protein [Stutzerimonas kunmingensis]|uniref:tape measure protein n=1 Tax=Stutzerimonas kunmingensis TaxID=1211807 RepID=UPI0028A9C388|nr:tape measure protein [Stutzerimonas kunmingensis]